MLNYLDIESKVRADFESFTKGDVETVPQYEKKHFISMAAQLTMQAFERKTCYCHDEIDDFIHGLCHCFFLGYSAGGLSGFKQGYTACTLNK